MAFERSAPANEALRRSAFERSAPGPTRKPDVRNQDEGRPSGVPVVEPDLTPDKYAPERSAPCKDAPLMSPPRRSAPARTASGPTRKPLVSFHPMGSPVGNPDIPPDETPPREADVRSHPETLIPFRSSPRKSALIRFASGPIK